VFYPIFIELQNRCVLVVGGGPVAERKIESLLEAGAKITVVSPAVTQRLAELARSGRVSLLLRRFEASDLRGNSLAISATDDAATQKEVAATAASENILVNTVDKPELCDFIVPSILRRGDITVAISTSGKSPVLAAELRKRFDGVLTEGMARTARVLGAVRNEVHDHFQDSEKRKQIFEMIIDSGIVEWIADCDDVSALARVREMIDGVK
jgi:precorrin-2 dehydrogenase / sirohydrochlorin ferrochelatase